MTTLAIINSRFPHGSAIGQESLDLVLAAGSFGQQVSLFFLGDGVLQLLRNQSPEDIEQRNYSKTFQALNFYDVEDIYVCQSSLSERHLKIENLVIEVKVLEQEQLAEKIAANQHILRF